MVRLWKTIFLFILIFTCFQGYIPANANTGTNVSGTIYQNTTWTRAGSPYYLTGDIQVSKGAKLTVEPGVTIEGNNWRIVVDGDFEAVGNPNLKIILNDVIFNLPKHDPLSASIHLENTDIKSGNKSWGLITNLILKDSRIFNLPNPLTLFYPTKDVFIERNVFINSSGISVRTYLDAKVNILNNVFYNYTDYAVSNVVTTDSSETIVAYNSFLKNNGGYALVLPADSPTAKMTAINNYWGATDETAIKKMIYDKNIDPSSGSYINYKPYLLSPDKNTPYIKLVPPEKPVVYDVTDKSEYITGNAEKLSVIRVVNENNDLVGETKAGQNGDFRVNIKPQNAGSKLYVTATDDWFNKSNSTIITVKKFITVPTVNPINNKSTLVTGKTEPALIATVKIGTKAYTAKADGMGIYKVTIPVQNTGATISISAKDSEGNVSAVKTATVIRVAPNRPRVNSVNNKSTLVMGEAEPKAIITVKIGTKVYKAKVDVLGNYKVTIPVQNTGTTVSVTASDSKENVSSVKSTKVIRVAPNMPTVNAVNNKSTIVAGKTEPKAIVTVKVGTKTFTAKANVKGNYKVTIQKQRIGTKIYVNAKDKKGVISATKIITVSR
ncbi:Ig-like domain-containing protein [Bacillus sp. FJAT-49736]|uniref:Ig-like domain-containing protein n=1 Tax=Bacillus sp. FJAT-49736 TaxID=2833582 RepID=UPI001BC8EFF7|nr:Ig-like domain-containing protein [Bacillus sp. FJAT-49736]MBS4171707.1 hypothetical protein [Bacillus sp. FJAT-49736]